VLLSFENGVVAGCEYLPVVQLHVRHEGAQDGEGYLRRGSSRSHESQVRILSPLSLQTLDYTPFFTSFSCKPHFLHYIFYGVQNTTENFSFSFVASNFNTLILS